MNQTSPLSHYKGEMNELQQLEKQTKEASASIFIPLISNQLSPIEKDIKAEFTSTADQSSSLAEYQAATYLKTAMISKQQTDLVPSSSSLKPLQQNRIESKEIIDPSDPLETTLPLIGARLDIMARIDCLKPMEYNARLASLSTVLSLLTKQQRKYNFLLSELKASKSSSTIQSFKEKISDCLQAVFRYHEIQNGGAGEIDLNLFISTVTGLKELNMFNFEKREKIIASYRAYCTKSLIEMNEVFISKFIEKRTEELNEERVNPLVSKLSLLRFSKSNKEGAKEECKKSDIFEGMKIKGQNYNPVDLTLSDREACVICMAKLRGVIFMPCRHFIACKSCSTLFQDCPICTKKITNKISVFWS